MNHGMSPQNPIVSTSLQHWVNFQINKQFNTSYLNASVFHYTTSIGDTVIDEQFLPLCNMIKCDKNVNHLVTDVDTTNLVSSKYMNHLIEFYDTNGKQLLCSEIEIIVEPVNYTVYANSGP